MNAQTYRSLRVALDGAAHRLNHVITPEGLVEARAELHNLLRAENDLRLACRVGEEEPWSKLPALLLDFARFGKVMEGSPPPGLQEGPAVTIDVTLLDLPAELLGKLLLYVEEAVLDGNHPEGYATGRDERGLPCTSIEFSAGEAY